MVPTLAPAFSEHEGDDPHGKRLSHIAAGVFCKWGSAVKFEPVSPLLQKSQRRSKNAMHFTKEIRSLSHV
jgi:hypothetical protein